MTKEDNGLASVSSYLEVSLSDGGIYECIIANRLVSASVDFTLTVRGKSCPLSYITLVLVVTSWEATTVMVGYGRDELPHIIWKYVMAS